MDRTRDIQQNKPISQRQVPHIFSHMWTLEEKGGHEVQREQLGILNCTFTSSE
jgi:hypothetical protein